MKFRFFSLHFRPERASFDPSYIRLKLDILIVICCFSTYRADKIETHLISAPVPRSTRGVSIGSKSILKPCPLSFKSLSSRLSSPCIGDPSLRPIVSRSFRVIFSRVPNGVPLGSAGWRPGFLEMTRFPLVFRTCLKKFHSVPTE